MGETKPSKDTSLSRLGKIWFISLLGVLLAAFGIGWFDNTTELSPSHDTADAICFLGGGLAAVVSAGVGVWQSAKMPLYRRVGLTLAFLLLGGMSVFLFLGNSADIIEGIIDFPPDKTQSSQEHLMISRAYQTHGKGRSWNIQTTPLWSNIDITQDDYDFMLSHRRLGDDGGNPDEISSNGYFCAKVTVQISGDAIRVMNARSHKLPSGSVVICPAYTAGRAHTPVIPGEDER